MFNKYFFIEHQKALLSYLNSSIAVAVRRSLWIPDYSHPLVKLTPHAAHMALPNGEIKVILYSNPQYGQALQRNYKPLWEALHWWDMRLANRWMPAWNAGFDTYSSQPDDTSGIDTPLDSYSPTTNLDGTILQTGDEPGFAQVYRSLIKFDLSSIPASATGSNATLSLWLYGNSASNARDVRVYRQKRAWVETQATWNNYSTGNAWSTAGGFHTNDCEQTDIGSLNLAAAESVGEKQWSLTAASMQAMWDGSWTNNGFLLKADTENADAHYYRASNYATGSNRPKMQITYTLGGSGFFAFF